jgi:hypothetical protein
MAGKRDWLYDPRESQRRGHVWPEARGGFVIDVGKCSSGIDAVLAQRLVDRAIPYSRPGWRKKYPERLYNTHEGIPYRAHQMGPGRYHGFPEKPKQIPPVLREELRSRAAAEGREGDFDVWMAVEDL